MRVADTADRVPDASGAAWAAFDAAWYAMRYREAAAEAGGSDAPRLLAHYLGSGRARGHAPNPFFDEGFYLARYPEVAAAVRAGTCASGFAHYSLHGHREGRDPHWLFGTAQYRTLNPGLDLNGLPAQGFADAYDHYLRVGSIEGRRASLFLDPAHALARMAPAAATAARAEGVFRHLVARLPGEADAIEASPWFDAAWYLDTYPAVAREIAAGRWQGALHHYLANPTPAAFDPLPAFSERYYRHIHPDVAQQVQAGRLRSGYEHFLADGAAKLRSPMPMLDLGEYADANLPAEGTPPAARGLAAFRRLVAAFAPRATGAVAARGEVVLVLGMHRSGTSFVAGQLVRAGLSVPGTPMLGEGGTEGGFFEPREVVALNETTLRAAGGGWHDMLRPRLLDDPAAARRLRMSAEALLGNILAAPGGAVIKDPRMCLVLPCWLDALEALGARARLVVVVRSAEEVALSLHRRNGISLVHGRLLWARYNLELARGLVARGRQPDAVLRYDALDRGLAALAGVLGLPALAAGAPGWRPGGGAAPAVAAGEPGAGLERIAGAIVDAASFFAVAEALEAELAAVQALAPLVGPLLHPYRRMEL
jgi:hypothetical protein